MQEQKLDIMATKEEQLRVLVPYLEEVAIGYEKALPITSRSRVLFLRYMGNWTELCGQEGLSPEGAFLYYGKLKGELWKSK